MAHVIGIYLFDDVEVLDFAGPFEVFSTAARVKLRVNPTAPPAFEVLTLADSVRPICARGGLIVQPNFGIINHPTLDVLIIPGGIVTAELQRDEIIDWIVHSTTSTTITASVCTGAFLLGRAGLLQEIDVTTHWEDIDDLRSMFPDTYVRADSRWVDSGKVVTSAGISAGIDMSLHIVERLESKELAQKTARQMEYDWQSSETN